MKIPNQYYELLINEFKEIQKLSNEVKSNEDKLYFFSASYGVLNRVLNFHCDTTLVFMHQVLQVAHQNIMQRLSTPKNPGSISNALPDEIIESLFSYFSLLISEIEKKDTSKIREILEKISNISYATTGNGFYLYLKGKLIL